MRGEILNRLLGVDRKYYTNLLKESGYADAFDFLLSIPDDLLISTSIGQELYLIIPCDPNARVTINERLMEESNDYTGEPGNILYNSQNGAPFLLKCNYSDIMPDSRLIITDSDGRTLTWHPAMSLENGRLLVDNEGLIYDFTSYEEWEE